MQYTLTVNTKPRTQDEANITFIMMEIVKKLDKIYPESRIFFTQSETPTGVKNMSRESPLSKPIKGVWLIQLLLPQINSKHIDILALLVYIPIQDADLFMRSEPTLSRKCIIMHEIDGVMNSIEVFFNEAHIEIAKIIDKAIIKIKQQKTNK